jgi:hypothetical protein
VKINLFAFRFLNPPPLLPVFFPNAAIPIFAPSLYSIHPISFTVALECYGVGRLLIE